MNDLRIVNLSTYTTPEIVEKSNKEWVSYGENNNYFKYLIDRYNGSPTNNAIINGISEMIYGRGLDALNSNKKPEQYAKMISLFHKDMVRKLCYDLKLMGQCSMQVIYSKDRKTIAQVEHIPVENLRAEKCNDKGEIEAYYYADDWNKVKNVGHTTRIPAFGCSKDGLEVKMVNSNFDQLIGYPEIELVGHIDGKVRTPDKNVQLLEIKSMSQFEFDRWMKTGFDGFPQYLDQVACYMEATQLPECLYIVKNRSSGYVDRRVIKPMEGYINAITSRLTEVANSVAEGKLFPAEFDIMSIECRRCDYKSLCIPEPTELDKATKEQLDKAVEDIRLGNRFVAEGKEFYDRGKAILKNHTKASNLRKWKYNNLAILLVNVKENVTYPKEALLAKYGEQELADIAKIKEAYDYLRLDDLEAKENGN